MPEAPRPPAPGPGARHRARLWPYTVVVLVAVALFAPFFFRGQIFLAADTLRIYLPWSSYAPPGFQAHNALITDPLNANFPAVYNAQLKQGGLAAWNPKMFTGLPATGVTSTMGGPGRLSPLKLLLHRIFPVTTAFMLLNFAYVCLMGCTMFAFLNAVGAGVSGALFGGVAFMLNGYLMVWLEFESVAATAALVPLMLLIIERYRGSRRLAAASAGGLVLGTICLMGMIQYVIYSWLLLGAYLLFTAVRAWRERGWRPALDVAACFLLSALIAGLISAVEYLPAQELIGASSRIARSFGFREFFERLGSVPGRWWVTLLFPDFFGSPAMGFAVLPSGGAEYMNYNEICLYLGVPTLLALLGAVVAGRRPHGLLFLGFAGVSAAMVAGSALYWPLFRFVPGMDRMVALRLIFLFTLTTSAAAAFGVRALEEADGRRVRVFVACCAAFAAAVLAFALLADGRELARWFNREHFGAPRPGTEWAFEQLIRMRGLRSAVIAVPLATALAAAGLFAAFARSRRLRPLAYALLVALLAADLISFGRRYNTVSSPSEIFPETPSIAFLKRQPGPFRILTDGGRGFMANAFVPFGLEEVGGYSSFYPERVGRLMSFAEYGDAALQGRRFDRWIMFGNLESPLFNLMNVKYVVTHPGLRNGNTDRFREVFRGDVAIFENLEALPRAWVVPAASVARNVDAGLVRLASPGFDPRAEVVLDEPPDPAFLADAATQPLAAAASVRVYTPDRVEIDATLPARGWLVLADTFYPGWEATVDGAAVPIVRANCNFRAVPLRAGTHRVAFEFHSRSLARGRLLTALGCLLGFGGLAIAWVRERRASSAGHKGDGGA